MSASTFEDIAREQWSSRLRSFGLEHHGWLAGLELANRNGNTRLEARELPLVALEADLRGFGPGEIRLVLGRAPEPCLHVCIGAPIHIRLWFTQQHVERALELESQDGLRVRLSFRVAVPAETLDGICSAELVGT